MFTIHKDNLLTAIVVFILSIFTVLVVIADPSLRYTLAGLSTLELVSTAPLRHAYDKGKSESCVNCDPFNPVSFRQC